MITVVADSEMLTAGTVMLFIIIINIDYSYPSYAYMVAIVISSQPIHSQLVVVLCLGLLWLLLFLFV
eukprot:m.91901 g.91901  ORF g.91901 m.91901 type:complete len:67 (+) comp8882_c0_seq1:69-269(+)